MSSLYLINKQYIEEKLQETQLISINISDKYLLENALDKNPFRTQIENIKTEMNIVFRNNNEYLNSRNHRLNDNCQENQLSISSCNIKDKKNKDSTTSNNNIKDNINIENISYVEKVIDKSYNLDHHEDGLIYNNINNNFNNIHNTNNENDNRLQPNIISEKLQSQEFSERSDNKESEVNVKYDNFKYTNKVNQYVNKFNNLDETNIEDFKHKWLIEKLNDKMKAQRLKKNEINSLNSTNISEIIYGNNDGIILINQITNEEKYEKIKSEFKRLNKILLPDKLMRTRLFSYLANNDKIFFAFYKQIYYLTLDHETMKRKLYHKYDNKVLDEINIIDFLKKINKFLNNYDPEAVEFNRFVYGIYD